MLLTQTVDAAQKDITAMYAKWDKAIVGRNNAMLDSMLAPTFVAKLKGGKSLTKKQFLKGITGQWTKDGPREKAFTTKIVTFAYTEKHYLANISESVTFAYKNGSSKKVSWKSLDTWKKGKTWQIVATESSD